MADAAKEVSLSKGVEFSPTKTSSGLEEVLTQFKNYLILRLRKEVIPMKKLSIREVESVKVTTAANYGDPDWC
jgi:hypothetical protein